MCYYEYAKAKGDIKMIKIRVQFFDKETGECYQDNLMKFDNRKQALDYIDTLLPKMSMRFTEVRFTINEY